MAKYFITGATGSIGKETVNALLSKGAQVVAASRDPEKARQLLGDKVESVFFDFEDKSTYPSLADIDGAFVLGPPMNPGLYELVEPFIDHLAANAIGKLVYLSANGMHDLKELPFHSRMEDKLKQSPIDWTVLRPGFFMQNFGNYDRENIEERKVIFSPAGEGKTAFVSTRDIGEAAAVSLTGKEHKNKIYTLTGDKLYSYHDAAQVLSEVLGEDIGYPNPDEETYRAVLKQGGAPDFIADYMVPIYGMIKQGKVDNMSPDLESLIGRKPEQLEEVLKRDFLK